MESFISKATGEVSAFFNFSLVHWYVPKVPLLEISRNSLSTEVASLQSTGCNATKNKLLIFGKFPWKAL